MKKIPGSNLQTWIAIPASTLLTATLAMAMVAPSAKTFSAGEKANVKGVIISHDGDTLKVRGDDDSVDTIDLTGNTKIELKKGGLFGRKSKMDNQSLVPGLHIEAQGKGNEKGDLVAEKVYFDPNSMRASRQIDTRVQPLEARTGSLEGRQGQLEGRTGTLESRAGQIESRQGDLENTEKQTQQQVGQVRETATKGINDVNSRVTNLDNYDAKYNATVYFRSGSAVLTPQAKQDLDDIATKAKNEKGFVIEVAGFADTTGNVNLNQELSQRRADAVIHYLEENGDIPIHRILAPAGLGTSHEVADNKTRDGRKLNRRVEVKVLVNQGLVASNSNGSSSTDAASPSTGSNSGTSTPSTSGSSTNAPSTTTTPQPPQQ
jgi:outer membrane protein OmpA-like peptidoglycan-associated protein